MPRRKTTGEIHCKQPGCEDQTFDTLSDLRKHQYAAGHRGPIGKRATNGNGATPRSVSTGSPAANRGHNGMSLMDAITALQSRRERDRITIEELQSLQR